MQLELERMEASRLRDALDVILKAKRKVYRRRRAAARAGTLDKGESVAGVAMEGADLAVLTKVRKKLVAGIRRSDKI